MFDVLQFFLSTSHIQRDEISFKTERNILRMHLMAYDLVYISSGGPTIVPNASLEEGQAIRQTFADLAKGPFDGARRHLQQAAAFINGNDAAKAIGETIHSVESVVRVIAPNTSFRQALAALDARANIHPAVKEGAAQVVRLYQ